MADAARDKSAAPNQLAQRVEELEVLLRDVEPSILCERTGAAFRPIAGGTGEFQLLYWGRETVLQYPDFSGYDERSGKTLGIMDRAMLIYYFTTSDGTPSSGSWISFTELPNGSFYTQAFQGYTGAELTKVFGNDLDSVKWAAARVGGQLPIVGSAPGDWAAAFQVLPLVNLLLACWLGDEDFPASYRVLFDASASHHLSTDAYAILGSMLTRRLLKVHETRSHHNENRH